MIEFVIASHEVLTKQCYLLTSSHEALTKRRYLLTSSYEALMTHRYLLMSSHEALTTRRYLLMSSHEALTKEMLITRIHFHAIMPTDHCYTKLIHLLLPIKDKHRITPFGKL